MCISLVEVVCCCSGVCLRDDLLWWVYNNCFVWQRIFILWYIFGFIKIVNPPCQVHPYVILPPLLEKVDLSWFLGALLFQDATSCAHFPCVQKYWSEKSSKGLWGCPCLGSVSAWQVWVLQLLVCTTPPVWFVCIWIINLCIYLMLVSIWGRILDTSVATLATGVGWAVSTLVGAGFGVGMYSGSWGGQGNGSPDMCETMILTRLAWWYPAASIVSLPVSSS